MIKYLLSIFSVVVFACGGPSGIVISDADKATFEKNYKAFEKHHIGGVVAEDLDLFLDLYSDTLKWSGPNVYDCLLYTSPSPRDRQKSRMPSSA